MFLPRSINPGPQPSFRILPGGPAASYCASGQLTSAYGVASTVTRATTKYCTAADGVSVVSLATGVPAVESKGLLIEAAHTNLVLRSQEIDNASWIKTGGSGAAAPVVTADAAIAPDGTLTADLVQFAAVSTAGQRSDISQSFATSATSYTFSLWIKGAAASGTIYLLWFDGTIVAKIPVNFTTSWQRLTFTTALNASGSAGFSLGYSKNSWDATGAAADVHIWGVQCEANAFARSYVPTTSATATGNADVVTFPATALPVTSGFLELDFTPKWSSQTLASLVDTRNGSFASGVAMYVSSTTLWFVCPSENAKSASAALTWTPGTTYRIRGEFQGGAVRLYRNGVLVGSGDGSATMPSTHSSLHLGSGATDLFHCNGHISNFSCGRL